jgi:Ca-activated chloride channel family protein
LLLFLSRCGDTQGSAGKAAFAVTVSREGTAALFSTKKPGPSLRIVSGSENRDLEFLLEDFCAQNGGTLAISYLGSLDIKNILEQGGGNYDAVWPANSMWLSLGDTSFLVKHTVSIYQTPVVFGIKQSLAASLGFIGRDVSVADILAAIRVKKLGFCMTSATQSNSGACAYISFLYALLGGPEMIRPDNLDDPALRQSVRELLKGVNRSSGSSDWLKELFLSSDYDAMVNYETLIISANKRLREEGREALYLVYPREGVAMADSPLGYIDRGDSGKESYFKKLRDYLLSPLIQGEIQKTGRRTGFIPISEENKAVFNPADGIDLDKTLSVIKMPDGETLQKALALYQEKLRKPSLTFYCLDFSGSMAGAGEAQLKEAMAQLLDQDLARRNLLSAGEEDEHIFVLFDRKIRRTISVSGKDPEKLLDVYREIGAAKPGGGTNIYPPILRCFQLTRGYRLQDYSSAVIVMTDGESDDEFESFRETYEKTGLGELDIPVFSITFGDADPAQLNRLAALTRARVFDGKTDLAGAFKSAKGYN